MVTDAAHSHRCRFSHDVHAGQSGVRVLRIVVAARVERPTSTEIPQAGATRFQHPTRVLGEFDPTDPTHNMMLSGWLIFLAMISTPWMATWRGWLAATSDFGAQLDSLCDVVTFGVAPGFLLVKMCPYIHLLHHDAMWIIAASLPACAALRLARFNVETGEDDDHLHFSGLPSPAAAAAIAGFCDLVLRAAPRGQHAAIYGRRSTHGRADGPAVFRHVGGGC